MHARVFRKWLKMVLILLLGFGDSFELFSCEVSWHIPASFEATPVPQGMEADRLSP